ncbi:MAG TPA: hypothetical protein VJ652_06265 [Noviherbaspirillum sp.]|nr:hypothetical protein [Noviherbaspirillum sp.]
MQFACQEARRTSGKQHDQPDGKHFTRVRAGSSFYSRLYLLRANSAPRHGPLQRANPVAFSLSTMAKGDAPLPSSRPGTWFALCAVQRFDNSNNPDNHAKNCTHQ